MCQCKNQLMPSPCTILDIERHTEQEWNFRVSCDVTAEYGQFVEVSLPLAGEAPISVSDHGAGYIDLLIRNVGKVTAQLFSLHPGDQIWMRGVYGHGYPIAAFDDKHLIIVAGGTGVAPVKGLINHFHQHPDKLRNMEVILGFKDINAVLYKRDICQWSASHHVITTLETPANNNAYQQGMVTEHIDQLDLSHPEHIQLIVVGPPVMIKYVVQRFMEKGLDATQIWVDYERRMACAVGKCGHCRIGDKYVCLDGPVFRFDQARQMVD